VVADQVRFYDRYGQHSLILYANRQETVNNFDLKGVKEMKKYLWGYRLSVGFLLCAIITTYIAIACFIQIAFDKDIFNYLIVYIIAGSSLLLGVPLGFLYCKFN
jgi:hypothetical protein